MGREKALALSGLNASEKFVRLTFSSSSLEVLAHAVVEREQ